MESTRNWEVGFTINISSRFNEDEILRWLEYKLGYLGDISCDHPMVDAEIEAERVWID